MITRPARAARRRSRHRLVPAELLAAVAVAAHREQHLRGDLREPVDHAVRAEIRRAGRPDGAQAGRGQQADDRLGDVRQERGHPVPLADAERAQCRRGPGPPRRPARRRYGPRRGVLGAGDDRGAGRDRCGPCAARSARSSAWRRGTSWPRAAARSAPGRRRAGRGRRSTPTATPRTRPARRPTSPRDPGSQRRRRRDARPASAGTAVIRACSTTSGPGSHRTSP